MLASSGTAPRLIVAFPAGNTGIGLWFEHLERPVQFGVQPGTQLEGVNESSGLRGVTAQLRSDGSSLVIRAALLANVRTLRDYIARGQKTIPREYTSEVRRDSSLVFHRAALDGKTHMELRIVPERGTRLETKGDRMELRGAAGEGVAIQITALADDEPLTPFAADGLFTPAADPERRRAREVFAFLVSREKFTAGSWRFLTYFGRDTLLSEQLLLPALQPGVVEAALGSVLERLGPGGEVAHEEGIGEFAAQENLKRSPRPADLRTPVLDYKMIDGEFLLAPALASYLLDTPGGRNRASAFLARRAQDGETYAARIRKNVDLVLERTRAFAAQPAAANLLSLKPGVPVGNWRDSENGLGGGRYPFDVNVALAPAALEAIVRLERSGLLGRDAVLETEAAQAERAANVWRSSGKLFRLSVPEAEARERVARYARSLQLDPGPALASIHGPIAYDALSLNADGSPVPVMQSDSGFVLFFTRPDAAYLEAVAQQLLRPFPAGLATNVGLVVANPVFGDDGTRRLFTTADYHGTVVWSWQQALMAAGLERQLARHDLPSGTRSALEAAQRRLWELIRALQRQSAGELWSWKAEDGREALVPYGQGAAHADESNAAQLWSTVYLAVRPPR
ncbi:hypothetical protein DB347_06705 [Opitutaceae bacterium EW11]|nr:hypothetical protein DB347_06705 [Opitutaceae bacterium EW11]